MRQKTIDQTAIELAHIAAPEWFVREWIADLGRPMTNRQWRRYWQTVQRVARERPSRASS